MLYNRMRLESHTGQLLTWLCYFVVFLSHNQARPTIISPLDHDLFLPHPSQLTFHKWGDYWHCIIIIIWYIDAVVVYTVKELRDLAIMREFSTPCTLRNYWLSPRSSWEFCSTGLLRSE